MVAKDYTGEPCYFMKGMMSTQSRVRLILIIELFPMICVEMLKCLIQNFNSIYSIEKLLNSVSLC
jgi:hypothetical protein